jgi:hypothetical protein
LIEGTILTEVVCLKLGETFGKIKKNERDLCKKTGKRKRIEELIRGAEWEIGKRTE